MVASDIMTPVKAAVDPATTIVDVAALMGRQAVGAALVLDDGSLVGIFTERDILKAVGAPGFNQEALVKDFMTENPQTIGPEADIEEALRRMLDGRFRHLPVVGQAGNPIGMLSMRDLAGSFRPLGGKAKGY